MKDGWEREKDYDRQIKWTCDKERKKEKKREKEKVRAYESEGEREEERESITIDNIDLNGRAQNKFIKMLIFNLLKKNN